MFYSLLENRSFRKSRRVTGASPLRLAEYALLSVCAVRRHRFRAGMRRFKLNALCVTKLHQRGGCRQDASNTARGFFDGDGVVQRGGEEADLASSL